MNVMEHFLFLSSNDSLNYHKSNHWADFTIELNHDVRLEGHWKVALLDFTCDVKASGKVTVCCDLCSPSWINDRYEPVLRSFYAQEGYFTINFPFPYYFQSHACAVKRVRVYILTDTTSSASFTNRPLQCTLHLKKQ